MLYRQISMFFAAKSKLHLNSWDIFGIIGSVNAGVMEW